MSTSQQKYTIENQAAAIAAYAARRGIRIVETYSDLGRSGVQIAGREGLKRLIRDVQRGSTKYDCILVYDISRWGRFQDVDESAYYEFICRRAGINIHYCAEEFENDGSLTSIVLKNMKRVGAADFSRQLSKKVFLGQSRVTTLGHWRGGPATFGLRRMLVGADGKDKAVLQYGQRKSLKTEHIILVPGPRSEIRIVEWIFSSFADKKMTRTEIASDLNDRGILNACGKRWSSLTISNMLRNEIYLGHIIYNRRSQKLGEKQIDNPRDMWIRRDNAFKPIVPPKLFAKAQAVLVEQTDGRIVSDKKLLDDLRALWRKKGYLTMNIMQSEQGVAHAGIYCRRFGSITNAYKKIGFKPKRKYGFAELAAMTDATIQGVAADIIVAMKGRRTNVTFLSELHLLTINQGLTVGMVVARSVSNGVKAHLDQPARRWEVRKLKYRKSDLTLVIRMNTSNTRIKDYFLMPSADLPVNRNNRIRISDRIYGEFGYGGLDAVLRAITDRLRDESLVRSARASLSGR